MIRFSIVSMMSLCLLAGCGGGGGAGLGGDGQVAGLGLNALSSPASFENAEYDNSNGLAQIKASSLFAVGGTGTGIKVAVIDSGIDTTHSDFAGAIDPESIDINTSATGAIGDASGHGTSVAGIIAARRNGSGTHGVAYNSTILAIRSEIPGSCAVRCQFSQSTLASATNYAVAKNAKVINYSLGGANGLSSAYRSAMSAAVDQGRLLVFAAGNNALASPSYPGMFAAEGASDGAAIVVGAVDSSNNIASFSNRAGSAASRFLVAPGVNIRTTSSGGGTATASGTSFAAPFVSGAAAAIFEAAPYLSAAAVANLLLGTATDLGAAGTDPIYGRGLLNLDAAMAPQGAAVVPSSSTVSGRSSSLSASSLSLGGAFGDAFARRVTSAMFLDGYGRSYSFDPSALSQTKDGSTRLDDWFAHRSERSLVQRPGPKTQLSISQSTTMRPDNSLMDAGRDDESSLAWSLDHQLDARNQLRIWYGGAPVQGLSGDPMLAQGLTTLNPWQRAGWLGLQQRHMVGAGWSVAGTLNLAFDDDQRTDPNQIDAGVTSFELAHRASGRHYAGLQVGHVVERQGFIGSEGAGALSLGRQSRSQFLNFFGGLEIGTGLSLKAQAMVARSKMDDPGQGMIRGSNDLISAGFKLALEKSGWLDDGDRVTLGIAQPLRAERGAMSLNLPVARTFGGDIVYDRRSVQLNPSGREFDLEAAYVLRFNQRFDLAGNFLLRVEPGHVEGADPEAIATVRLRYNLL